VKTVTVTVRNPKQKLNVCAVFVVKEPPNILFMLMNCKHSHLIISLNKSLHTHTHTHPHILNSYSLAIW